MNVFLVSKPHQIINIFRLNVSLDILIFHANFSNAEQVFEKLSKMFKRSYLIKKRFQAPIIIFPLSFRYELVYYTDSDFGVNSIYNKFTRANVIKLYEDGTASYVKNLISGDTVREKFYKALNLKVAHGLSKEVSEYFVSNPRLMKDYRPELYRNLKITSFEIGFFQFILENSVMLNDLFGYKDDTIPLGKSVCIICGGHKGFPEFEIAKDIIVLYKPHPHFSGYMNPNLNYIKSSIPIELVAANIFSKGVKCTLVHSSSAVPLYVDLNAIEVINVGRASFIDEIIEAIL